MNQGGRDCGRAGVHCGDLIALLCSQEGKPYVFGAEVSPDDQDPVALDCSEILEWACARLGVAPRVPDGSWLQYRHCVRAGLAADGAYGPLTEAAVRFRQTRAGLVPSGEACPALLREISA
jgi:peptidoglycan hydrolase-like protein with peptidoglycan-binding domain